MNGWIGYSITLVSGGLAGALITRLFILKDRKTKKLTLKSVKEEVRSIVPLTIKKKRFTNLTYKEFLLVNETDQNFDLFDLYIEFDKESEIVEETTETKLGLNKCGVVTTKPSERRYQIRNFNRKDKIIFKFQVAGITQNFFSAVIDKTGVELKIIAATAVEKPSISPSKYVSKTTISKS